MQAATATEPNRQSTSAQRTIRVVLFGAAPDTGNMGVSALFHATALALYRVIPELSLTVFDNGLGRRTSQLTTAPGEDRLIQRLGARPGHRYERPENLTTMSLLAKLGRLGPITNANVRAIDQAHVVLDLSGGDSFSDLYGNKRFYGVLKPKLIAIRRRTPLILLPQTYGPFQSDRVRSLAAWTVRRADMCWARDQRSFQNLCELLGDDFDPGRHRCGVDLAFGLQRHDSFALLPGELQRMIDADRAASPLVGFNLSGLIYHDAVGSRLQYGFRADYAALVVEFLRWLLRHSTANLVLIPHVMTALGHHESDAAASQSVAELLSQDFPGRVVVSPSSLDQNQVKWLIGQTDWFCGTRMHATIAALSSGVPTATIAYSDKALGVFESCGQAGHVVDPRQLDTRQVMEQLIRSFRDRESAKLALAAQLPQVDIQFRQQISLIAARVRSLAEDRNGAGRGVSADAGEQQS